MFFRRLYDLVKFMKTSKGYGLLYNLLELRKISRFTDVMLSSIPIQLISNIPVNGGGQNDDWELA